MTELNGIDGATMKAVVAMNGSGNGTGRMGKVKEYGINGRSHHHHQNHYQSNGNAVNGKRISTGNGYMSADEEEGGVSLKMGHCYDDTPVTSIQKKVPTKVNQEEGESDIFTSTTAAQCNSESSTTTKPMASTSSPSIPSTFLTTARALNRKITSFLEADPSNLSDVLQNTQKQTQISLDVVKEALERYRFEELAMSYNGGKDCLVLLIILLAGVARWYDDSELDDSIDSMIPPNTTTSPRAFPRPTAPPVSLSSVYVTTTHPFPEVDAFVSTSITTYSLTLDRYPLPMKSAFSTYLTEHPLVKAIFVGTRRTDPHGEFLTFFDKTDHGWPDFMRVHPVIDWHYQEVWAFLRYLEVPYCPLYDRGYTSLGGTTDTYPNPVLATGEGVATPGGRHVVPGFRPAYELLEDEQERLGREGR